MSTDFFISFLVFCLIVGLGLTLPKLYEDAPLPDTIYAQLPDTTPAPTLSMTIQTDDHGTLNLTFETTNFIFTELCTTVQTPVPVGHVHIYVDGMKAGTAYTPQFQIPDLTPGEHVITASLRAKDHRVLATRDGVIMDEATITYPPKLSSTPTEITRLRTD